MLDSYNTEKIPYNTCATWATPGNLSFNSWNYGSAIINCSGNQLNFEGNTANLEFQGLTFLDSFLRVSDIFLIINNCSFGSFSQNTFPYLIHVSVNNPRPNFGIYITSSNFLERNTAGALHVINYQGKPCIVEIRHTIVAKNYLKEANYIIFIQGYVNFSIVNSEISNTKLLENISKPTLIYFYGCPDMTRHDKNASIDNRWGNTSSKGKNSQHEKLYDDPELGSPTIEDDSIILSFDIKALNFSSNQAGIVQTIFCISGNVSVTDATFFNNTNRWILDGSLAIIAKNKLAALDILIENSSFVANVNENTGPLVSVVSVNANVFVTNCTFCHNNGGAMYVSASPASKITVRNSSVQFSKSSEHVLSHCGAQICVMFRYPDDYVLPVKEYDNSFSHATGMRSLTKLSRGEVLKSRKAEFKKSRIHEPLLGHLPGSLCRFLHQSVKPGKGGLLLEQNASVLKTESDVVNSKFLKMNESFIFDHNKTSLEYGGEFFGSGLLVEDCNFNNNTGFLSSSAALEVHSEPYISLAGHSPANVSIRRCKFVGNAAKDGSGAIYVAANIYFIISNCLFHDNAGSSSGAIYFSGSIMVIKNCMLDNNSGGYAVYTQATGSVRLTKKGTAFIQGTRIIQRHIVQTVPNMGIYHSSLAVSCDSFDKIVLSNSVVDCKWLPSLEKVIVLEVTHTKGFALKDIFIICPWGYKIKRRIISESEQSFECELCTIGSYSLDRGIYR